ncbi:MAG: dockerin type I repeat-containing protein [Ruminococcus sp.]|nr:dockerin type I repeat-containing protein [Ruminococcus sp.]
MKMKMKKIIAILIAVLLVLSVAPITAFAEKGPAVQSFAFISIYSNTSEDDYYTVFGDGKAYNDAIEGATYDLATNTLTLKDFNHPELSMSTNMMGDDFTVVIDGECALDMMYIWGWGYGGSLNIQGTGTLTVNESKSRVCSIMMNAEGSNANLNFGKDVKLNLYGKEQVAKINFSTYSDLATGINFENGQKIPVVSGVQTDLEPKYIEYINVEDLNSLWWTTYGLNVACATETDPNVIYAANYEEENDSYYVKRIIKLEDYDAYIEDGDFGNYGTLTLTSEEFAKSEYSLVTENLPVQQLYTTEWAEEHNRGLEADKLVRESDPDSVYVCNYSWTIDREHPDRYYIDRLVWDEDIEFYVPDPEFDYISYDPDEFAASDFSYVLDDDLQRETVRYLDDYTGIDEYGYTAPLVKKDGDPDGIYIAVEYSIEGEMQYWVTELVYNEKRGYYFEGETGVLLKPEELEANGYSIVYAEQPTECRVEYTQRVTLSRMNLYEDAQGNIYAAQKSWTNTVYDFSEDNKAEVLGNEYYFLTENKDVDFDSLTQILENVEYEGYYGYAIDTDELHYNEGAVPEPEFLRGDVNGDGKIDVTDATLVQLYAAEMLELTDEQLKAADANSDGKVDVTDATYIQLYAAELIDNL